MHASFNHYNRSSLLSCPVDPQPLRIKSGNLLGYNSSKRALAVVEQLFEQGTKQSWRHVSPQMHILECD